MIRMHLLSDHRTDGDLGLGRDPEGGGGHRPEVGAHPRGRGGRGRHRGRQVVRAGRVVAPAAVGAGRVVTLRPSFHLRRRRRAELLPASRPEDN